MFLIGSHLRVSLQQAIVLIHTCYSLVTFSSYSYLVRFELYLCLFVLCYRVWFGGCLCDRCGGYRQQKTAVRLATLFAGELKRSSTSLSISVSELGESSCRCWSQ